LKILIISDIFGRLASANGACSKEIAYELQARGHDITILQEKFEKSDAAYEQIEGFGVYRISTNLHQKLAVSYFTNGSSLKGKLSYFLFRLLGIRTLLLLPWYPQRAPIQCMKMAKKAEQLHKKTGFDMVISCYNPLSALYAGERLKLKYGVFFVPYFVDAMTNKEGGKYIFTKEFIDKKGFGYESRFYSAADLILNLKCHEKHFSQKRYDPFKQKMKITDIPHLKNRVAYLQLDSMELVYTGSVRIQILSGMLDILSGIAGINLHFYSPNCIDVPDRSFIVKHGKVAREEALAAQDKAGCLISMAVPGTTFIAAKIFEYISTGKKIIHFYTDDFDPNLPYYKKYKNSLLINLNNDTQTNAKTISEFLAQPTQIIPWSELEELFPMNKAAYTADLILGEIGVDSIENTNNI